MCSTGCVCFPIKNGLPGRNTRLLRGITKSLTWKEGAFVGEVILKMQGIDKSFPGVHALDHVDLEIRKGEVHALMGENGAGKSTLMKVLTGIYTKDSGTILYEGREVYYANPREAQHAGIVIVHQELNMMGHLTVAQNIFIGREF